MRPSIEKLLTKIQAEFLAIDSEQIDSALISSQRQICEFFGTDRSALWQGSEEHPQTLFLTHLCTLDEIPYVPEGIKANDFAPWFTSQLLQNIPVIIPNVEKLPPEADIDKKNLLYFGDKSTLAIPFIAGANPAIYGALSFASTQKKTTWSDNIISECHLIAQVFSGAIARKNTIELLKAERIALIKAKEHAEKNEEKFRNFLELLPVPTGVANQNGELILFNKMFLETYGYTVEDVRTIENWFNVAYPDETYRNFVISDWEEVVKFAAEHKTISPPREYQITCKNGEVKITENSMFQTSDNIITVFNDITERRRKDEEHRKSEEMFSSIANLSPDIISIISKDGELLYNSQAAFRIHGYTNEELIGKNTIELIHPEDREYILANLMKLNSKPGSFANVQYRYLNKNGSYTWMEATALNELENPLISGIISISRDISQRKKLEDDLKFALVVRDEFISIASHEFKTPITSLKLQLQILSRQIKRGDNSTIDLQKLLKALSSSTKQVDRMTDLVENLLDVARINTGRLGLKLEEFNLSEVLEDYLESFHGLFEEAGCPTNFKIQKNIIVRLDKNRIEQVFVNLISNAIKYAPGKLIQISLTQVNETAQFVIKDQGPGIPTNFQNNIFDKFKRATASKNISGLGLGLFITKQIIETHRGSIQVKSKPDAGAAFIVKLPLSML